LRYIVNKKGLSNKLIIVEYLLDKGAGYRVREYNNDSDSSESDNDLDIGPVPVECFVNMDE
jgi:hypothetical protein